MDSFGSTGSGLSRSSQRPWCPASGSALVAVSWIDSNSFGSLAHVDMVYDIREMMSIHGGLVIQFCSRASNSYAKNLAKCGSKEDEGDLIQWGSV
ncbi:hypothetical protein QYF36_002484 [Acer negundo]|nr:hypothetical protein QYF36_002484 [Acer negundo]